LGDYAEAKQLFQQGLTIAEEMGDRRGEARSLNRLAETAVALAQYDEGIGLYERSLAIFRELGNQWGMTSSLSGLAQIAWRQGHWAQAKSYFDEALRRAWDIQAIPRVMDILEQMTKLLAERGDATWQERLQLLLDVNRTPYDSLTDLIEEILLTAVS
jgi:tetratricopeptide (TPR) repeat protein